MRGESRRHLAWPMILIVVGSLSLLRQLGVLSLSWRELLSWWPIILVFIGLDLILGRSRMGAVAFVLIALALAILPIILTVPPKDRPRGPDTLSSSYDNHGIATARVRLEVGLGELTVSPLSDSRNLYEAEVFYDEAHTQVTADVTRDGDAADVHLKGTYSGWVPLAGRSLDAWHVRLTTAIPLRLDISGGVSQADLDLRQLRLTRLDLKTGVGEVRLRLADRGPYDAYINGGIGKLWVEIPEGVEARVRIDGGIGSINVDNRFQHVGNDYVTREYRATSDAVDVDIDGGIGTITVR